MSEETNAKTSLISVSDIFGIGKASHSPAFERLVSGVLSGIGEGFQTVLGGWKAKRESKAKAEAAKEVLEIIPRDVSVELNLNERSQVRVSREAEKKQIAREEVSRLALTLAPLHLLQLDEANGCAEKSIGPGWLANFWNLAENASDEQMRALWAKVLLRKSVAPRDFSIRSLHIVSQLSYEEALMIERLAPFVVEFERKDKTTEDLAAGLFYRIGGSTGTFTLPKEVKDQFNNSVIASLPDFDLVTLSAAGVMQSTSYWASEYYIDYSPEVALQIASQKFVLEGLPQPNEQSLRKYGLGSGRGFTPEGCEIARITNAEPDPQFLEIFRAAISAANCSLIDVFDD